MKAKKIVRRVLLAAFLLAVLALAACQKQPETMLQPPIDGLTWGMTQEEAREALGLEKEDIYITSDSGNVWWLTPEQAGMETLAGLAFYGNEPFVEVAFKTYAGVERLYHVAANVQAENGPVVKETLTAAYGEPYEGDWTLWSGTDLEKNATEADVAKLDEYDLGAALQITGGERKLFAVRPFVTVQYYNFQDGFGPVLESNRTRRFRITYKADRYLLSQYGSAPVMSWVALDEPVYGLFMGMDRKAFAKLIGTTEEELLLTQKKRVDVPWETVHMDTFLGLPVCEEWDSTALRPLMVTFDEEGCVTVVQAYVLADSKQELENHLTRVYGDPVLDLPRWYDKNNPDGENGSYAYYVDCEAVDDGKSVFALFVVNEN